MATRREFIKTGIRTLAGFAITYPVIFERYGVRIVEYEITVPNLPEAFDGYRILHFSDLHYGFLNPRVLVKGIVDMANSANADVIACTGDYVKKSNTKSELNVVFPELMKLSARDGVYMVLGNHDHWANNNEALRLLEQSGRSVRHKSVKIERGGSAIRIAGTGDLWEDEPGIDKALSDVPRDECRIVLAHNPDTADTDFDSRIDLMLSGHTHGGQVVLPFIGPPFLPVKNRSYAHGLVKRKKCFVFISRGIGASTIPVRVNCYPEIPLLKLKCAKEAV